MCSNIPDQSLISFNDIKIFFENKWAPFVVDTFRNKRCNCDDILEKIMAQAASMKVCEV